MNVLSRFFRPEPEDAADLLIAWCSGKNLDDRHLVATIHFGGPHSLKVAKWVLSRPDCDIGTASMMLWTYGTPYALIRNKPEELFPVHKQVKSELIRFIVERWRMGLFVDAVFEFDPRQERKRYRVELAKKGLKGQNPLELPDAAMEPIPGRKPDRAVHFAELNRAQVMDGLVGALRAADLLAINPDFWEPIRRRELGLD